MARRGGRRVLRRSTQSRKQKLGNEYMLYRKLVLRKHGDMSKTKSDRNKTEKGFKKPLRPSSKKKGPEPRNSGN
jgi:hypothetical protein